VELLTIDLVLDVGAHEGEFARELRQDVHYRGDIISFEPAAAAAAVLRRVASQDSGWKIQQIALGNQAGSAELRHYFQSQLNSLRPPSHFGRETWHMHESTVETVRVARLDELALDLQKSKGIFLKVDTQGNDLAVLAGAEKILSGVKALQIEVPVIPLYEGTPLLEETLREVERLGFAISGLFPVAHDAGLRLIEVDLVALRA